MIDRSIWGILPCFQRLIRVGWRLFARSFEAMVYLVLLLLIWQGTGDAQTLELHQVGRGELGEVDIAVVADLGDARVSGISFYVAMPEGAFAVLGSERPFSQGPLLAPAMEFANTTMSSTEALGGPVGMVLLPYAAVRGPGADRGRSGRGIAARFTLLPLGSGPSWVRLISTPIYEAKLVLDDGLGEEPFRVLGDIELAGSKVQRSKSAPDGQRTWGRIKTIIAAP